MAAEEKQNSSTADSVNLMGEEEAEEETLETNEMVVTVVLYCVFVYFFFCSFELIKKL